MLIVLIPLIGLPTLLQLYGQVAVPCFFMERSTVWQSIRRSYAYAHLIGWRLAELNIVLYVLMAIPGLFIASTWYSILDLNAWRYLISAENNIVAMIQL